MGVTAIISDIHSNLEALTVVLADAKAQGAERILCLGDVIGYGPCPVECVDLARAWNACLMGNHEDAVLFGAVGFNPKASAAIEWTREQLNLDQGDSAARRARWDFVGNLPSAHEEGDTLYVHGSPRDPVKEYVFPTDALDERKLRSLFKRIDRYSFCGHTHHPGIITADSQFISPRGEERFEHELGRDKALVNVGSVGQPRDGDPRASYVLYDGKRITFRRVEYDVEATIERMLAIERLPEYLALRLREGR